MNSGWKEGERQRAERERYRDRDIEIEKEKERKREREKETERAAHTLFQAASAVPAYSETHPTNDHPKTAPNYFCTHQWPKHVPALAVQETAVASGYETVHNEIAAPTNESVHQNTLIPNRNKSDHILRFFSEI